VLSPLSAPTNRTGASASRSDRRGPAKATGDEQEGDASRFVAYELGDLLDLVGERRDSSRIETPSGASRLASHTASVFGTSPRRARSRS
jgi:hypothetical protein